MGGNTSGAPINRGLILLRLPSSPQVQHVFDESPFLVPDNSVSIMDGTSEGNVWPPSVPTSNTCVTRPRCSQVSAILVVYAKLCLIKAFKLNYSPLELFCDDTLLPRTHLKPLKPIITGFKKQKENAGLFSVTDLSAFQFSLCVLVSLNCSCRNDCFLILCL